MEEVGESFEVLFELMVIEVAADVQLFDVGDVCEHLNELEVFHELAVEGVGFVGIKVGVGVFGVGAGGVVVGVQFELAGCIQV
jgi:hypothetical protein